MRQNPARTHRGEMAHHAGASAEGQVSQDYERRGYTIAHKRWRGKAGEIDLIFRDGAGFIFVEVKKSHDFDQAAARLSRHQVQRIFQTAEEFSGHEPLGLLTDMRFDVALVDVHGCIKIIENAFVDY